MLFFFGEATVVVVSVTMNGNITTSIIACVYVNIINTRVMEV